MTLTNAAWVNGHVAHPSRDFRPNHPCACVWLSWAGHIKAISTLTSSRKAVISVARPVPGPFSCSLEEIPAADRRPGHRSRIEWDEELQTRGAPVRIRLCREPAIGWRHSSLRGERHHHPEKVWFS